MDRKWTVLIAASVPVFMTFHDVTIVNMAVPDMRATFTQDSMAELSWVLNAYNVIFAALLIPGGRLADRLGRRRVFQAGILIFLIASVICGLAQSLPILIAGRILQAVGGAVIVPTSLSLILPAFPDRQRATATALWVAAGAVAVLTGPPVGGFLVSTAGWPSIFLINLIIGLPALVATGYLLSESRASGETRWPDGLGATLLAGGVGALALTLVKGEDWGWGSWPLLATALSALVLLLLFFARSAGHPSPVVELSLLRIRSFSAANAGMLLFGASFYALLLAAVLFLTEIWNLSAFDAGLAMAPSPLAATAVAPIAGRLADRLGQRAVAVPGCLLFAAGATVLVVAMDEAASYLGVFLPAALLCGTGIGLVFPAFTSAAVAEIPRERFATGIGILSCCRHIGGVFGVAGVVAVLGPTGAAAPLAQHRIAWTIMLATSVLAAIAAACLGTIRVQAGRPNVGRDVHASAAYPGEER